MKRLSSILLLVCVVAAGLFFNTAEAAWCRADRVAESTTSTGTGAPTLAGAITGFRAFTSGCSTGDTVTYAIWGVDSSGNTTGEWETGIGTVGSTLTRSIVIASSNSGSLVSFSSGTKYIALSPLAADISSNDSLGAAGTVIQAMPSTARHPLIYWSPTNNSTTVPVVQGIAAFTAQGTATARAVAATNAATMIRRLGYVSSTTAGNLAGNYQGTAILWPGDATYRTSGFYYSVQFVPSDAATVSGARMFVGLAQSTSAPTNVDPAGLTNAIGVCQISSDTTQLYLCYGGSSAQTAAALGATNFPGQTLSTTAFEIAIYAPWNASSTYYVQIRNLGNGATYTNKLSGASSVVPQAGTALAPRAWRSNNATASAVALDVCTIAIQMGI